MCWSQTARRIAAGSAALPRTAADGPPSRHRIAARHLPMAMLCSGAAMGKWASARRPEGRAVDDAGHGGAAALRPRWR